MNIEKRVVYACLLTMQKKSTIVSLKIALAILEKSGVYSNSPQVFTKFAVAVVDFYIVPVFLFSLRQHFLSYVLFL